MNHNLTKEQQHIVDVVSATDLGGLPTTPLIAIDACAGSGKTTLLQALSSELNATNGLYLCYNKAIALESKSKFPKTIQCSTTHSLAHQNTIKAYNLRLGSFYWKSINERVQYEEKLVIVDLMKEWCMSEFDRFDSFQQSQTGTSKEKNPKYYEIVKKYFNEMIQGKIPISHDAYLKMYHMLLAHKKIQHSEFDVLMGDEVGDLAAVSFEIMKLLPAKRKILVGDAAQNIYTFNHTINCFDRIPSELVLSMSQSFRCHTSIANRIDAFTKKYIDPSKSFVGVDYADMSIKSIAYISRNNVALIEKIIELTNSKTKYNLFRPADSIFELILLLLSVNKQKNRITQGDYKYLQDDIDKWDHNIDLQMTHKSQFAYLKDLYGEEQGFKTAFHLIREYGPKLIYAAYDSAKQYEKDKTTYPISVGTVFGTKGLEFDKVYIMPDLNASVHDALEPDEYDNIPQREDFDENQRTTMYLYYTACSRARKELVNATYLPSLNQLDDL